MTVFFTQYKLRVGDHTKGFGAFITRDKGRRWHT